MIKKENPNIQKSSPREASQRNASPIEACCGTGPALLCAWAAEPQAHGLTQTPRKRPGSANEDWPCKTVASVAATFCVFRGIIESVM